MDREWPEDERDAFLAAAAEYPELAGLHDLRTRRSGTLRFVQFHVWVPADWTVAQGPRPARPGRGSSSRSAFPAPKS